MAMMLGGLDFPAGRLRQIAAVPQQLAAAPVVMRVRHRPEVHAGQTVMAGQVIAESRATGRGRCVSPFDGVVERMQPLENGGDEKVYEVRLVAEGRETKTVLPIAAPEGRELSNWLAAMRHVDPWADRDGGVGLLAQLQVARDHRPDLVILNGLDRFAPYPDSSSLLASFAEPALAGLRLIADLTRADDALAAVSVATKIAPQLRPFCRSHSLQLRAMRSAYPAADPTVLAWSVSRDKRRLAPGANPMSQRLVIVNPWTAIRLGRWLASDCLDVVRPILIGWPEAESTLALRYAIAGQPLLALHDRLEQSVGRSALQVLLGHPLNGRAAIHDGEDALVPDDELLLTCVSVSQSMRREPEACISCGWCAHVCPTRLRPAEMYRLCQRGGPADILLPQLSWCVDCGLCSQVCPSSLPLAQRFRQTATRFERIFG